MTKLLIRFKPFALALSYVLFALASVMFCAPKFAKRDNLKNLYTLQKDTIDACSQEITVVKRNQDRIQNDPEFFIRILHDNNLIGPYELRVNFHEPKPQ